jgi:hypothetical protein
MYVADVSVVATSSFSADEAAAALVAAEAEAPTGAAAGGGGGSTAEGTGEAEASGDNGGSGATKAKGSEVCGADCLMAAGPGLGPWGCRHPMGSLGLKGPMLAVFCAAWGLPMGVMPGFRVQGFGSSRGQPGG